MADDAGKHAGGAPDRTAHAERSYRQLVDAMPDAMAVHVDGIVVFINTAGLRLIGATSADEIIGRSILERVHPDYRASVVERARRVQQEGKLAGALEEKFVRLDGEVIDVEVSAVPHTFEGRRAVLVTARDITERKRMEDVLRERERSVRVFVESLPVLMWATDAQLRITSLRGRACASPLDAPAPSAVNQTVFAYFEAEDPDAPLAAAHRRALRGAATSFEMIWRGRTFHAHVEPVRGRDDTVAGTSGVALDISERRETELALHESEERLRLFATASSEGIIVHERGVIMHASPAAARMLGYEPGELVQMPVTTLTTPELRGVLVDRIRRGDESPTTALALRKNGTTFPVEVQGRTVRLGERTVRVVAVRDVSERTRVEEALRESEARYRLLVEGSDQVFFYLHDERGRFEYLSPSLREVLGYDPMELIGLPYMDLLTADPANAAVNANTALALATGEKVRSYRASVRHKEGHHVVLELVESPVLRDGRVLGIQGFARDVTELARAEERLRVSNEMLQSLIEASPLAIVAVDAEWTVTIWNRAAERLYGWSAAEVIGKPAPHVPVAEQRAISALGERPIERGAATGLELRRRRKDGQMIDVSASIAPLRDARGMTRGFMAVIADVTENKRLEAQLRQAQKMDAVGRLAGGLAHDFNNLLTVIAGHSELALRQLPADHALRSEVEEVTRAAARAAALTRQLLAFSRQQVLQPQELDLGEVVAGMEKMLARLIGEDVEVVTMSQPELGYVLADPGQIEQVVMNLLVNARDAMPNGGVVIVETANVELDETYVHRHGVISPGQYVLLAVSDTGAGMDGPTLTHLFEPFYTTKESGRGTGLGLSTVYGIVQQSGGGIVVDSTGGHGSVFKLFFPRIDSARDARAPLAAAAVLPCGTETVLVVEDDAAVRTLVREVLRTSGYTVLEAAYGDEALHVAAAYPDAIQLLVADVIMPHMSGPQLARRLSAMRGDLKVLFISGYTGDEIIRRGAGDLASTFLQKPFTPEQLLTAARVVLDAAHAG